jgi:hypothetical protein
MTNFSEDAWKNRDALTLNTHTYTKLNRSPECPSSNGHKINPAYIQWHTPVVPATWEDKAGGLLKPRSLGPPKATK